MSKIDDNNNNNENEDNELEQNHDLDMQNSKNDLNEGKRQLKENTAPARNATKKVLNNKKVRAFIVAHLPIILMVIGIILLIIFLLGIIIYILAMPGLFLAKLGDLTRGIAAEISGAFTGDNMTAQISKEQVIDLAQYLQGMGYDIQTYGLGDVVYEGDDSSDLNSDESSDDYNLKTTFNQNGQTRKITKIGKSVDGKNYLQAYIAADENTYNLSQVSFLGILDAATSKIFNLASDVANALTLDDDIATITNAQAKQAKTFTEDAQAVSTGLIEIDGYDDSILQQNNRLFVKIDRENRQMRVFSDAFSLTPALTAMYVSAGAISALNPVSAAAYAAAGTVGIVGGVANGEDIVQWGDVFTYDLDDWLARYGRPKELLLAIHLSTMMPDLAYKIATDQEFNTKVHVDFNELTVNYDIDATKDDTSLNTEQIIDLFLNKCLGSGEVQVSVTKKETADEDAGTTEDNGNGPGYETSSSSSSSSSSGSSSSQVGPGYSSSSSSSSGSSIVTKKITVTSRDTTRSDDDDDDDFDPDDYEYGSDEDGTLVEDKDDNNSTYKDILADLENNPEEKEKFFEEIWSQIESGIKLFDENKTEVSGFTQVWGVNILSAESKARGGTGFWESVKGLWQKANRHFNRNASSNTYVFLKISDEEIPDGNGWTYNEIINLARLAYKGNTGLKNVRWPYIKYVGKHWFYGTGEDQPSIDFRNGVYRVAKTATKTIDYKPDNKENALYKDNIQVKLNATMTSSANGGVIYQVCEPETIGPNDAIQKVFTDYEYYRYDGSELTAQRIANSKALDANKSTYTFRGQEYQVVAGSNDDSDDNDNSMSMTVKKQKVHFTGDSTSSLAAFGILENVHTEAADYIYRNLKELMVALKYYNESEMATDLKAIMLWPIQTEDQYTEWKTTQDDNEFGTTIICNPDETTVLCPTDATVESVDGDSITLVLGQVNSDTTKLYNYIYNRNSKYNLTNINADVYDGIKLTIKGISLNGAYTEGDTISRGAILGEASGETDGNKSITITMQNLDKSVIDDFEAYFYQTHNTKYEEIMLNQMKNSENGQTGIDISDFGKGSSLINNIISNFTIGANNIDGLKVTESTISRDEFISRTQAYASKYKDGGFALSAGTIYDICIKNGINPVWAAAQARMEGSWNIVRKKKNNYWSMGAVNSNSNAGEEYDTVEAATQRYCNNLNKRINGGVGAVERSKELQPYDSVHFHGAIVGLYDVFSNYAVPDGNPTPTQMAAHTVNYINKIIDITKKIYGEYGVNI